VSREFPTISREGYTMSRESPYVWEVHAMSRDGYKVSRDVQTISRGGS